MLIEANEEDFLLLYSRARESYAQCIHSKENEHLRREVSIPLEAIAVRDVSIKIVFHQYITGNYWVEVELALYANNRYMGKYTYSENNNGNEMEDGLVFY
jgi:hypothetical protein